MKAIGDEFANATSSHLPAHSRKRRKIERNGYADCVDNQRSSSSIRREVVVR